MALVWILLVGVALLAVSGWSWLGRSHRARWWIRTWQADTLVLGILPAMGLMLVALTLYGLAGPSVTAVAAPLWLACFPLALLGFVTPRWWGPAWYRELSPSERQAALRGALGTAVRAGGSARTADSTADARRGRRQPLDGWSVGWVRDPDTDVRDHDLSRKGTVQGRLVLYADTLTFAASATEDQLRGEPTVVVVDGGALRSVRTVPARAGADGRQRGGRLHRSWFRRLVLDTTDAAYVFEVAYGRAPQVAARIQATILSRSP